MMTTNAIGAPVFKLKPPTHYFADDKTLALLAAAMAGDLPKAKNLVAQGANPNDEGPRGNPYNRLRLLHYAMAARNREAIRVLVAVGADPELSVQGFGRAFLFALTLKDVELLSLLLELKPAHTLSKDTIEYLLTESVINGCKPCLELLLKRGAPIDLPDDAGNTIMMDAMDVQDYELAEWLLQQGASIQIETKAGVTPAYTVQFHLQKFKPGSPTYNKVLRLKNLMEQKGAVFPAPTPKEVRAKHAKP
ncbi:ankyrin repeat domain-containing protein [Geomonas sp. RF6]|uniref:ankyrin repeat domain-containing protein n=1 Tax=Geomonas sp. RF6 TaxID=2897342 RepID=UPI001E56B1FB|nr:ankyrin repeat domain-containing protein [Geomonas sp. RF6]UFS71707.1 ankyrin repeat domain-containing protein [Geomonas sp. RF6]